MDAEIRGRTDVLAESTIQRQQVWALFWAGVLVGGVASVLCVFRGENYRASAANVAG